MSSITKFKFKFFLTIFYLFAKKTINVRLFKKYLKLPEKTNQRFFSSFFLKKKELVSIK